MLKGIVKGNNLLNEKIFSDADSTHINYMKSNPVTLSASVTYTFSCNVSCNGLYIRDVSNDDNIASGNNVSSVSYTPDNDIQVYFRIWNNSGVTGLQPMVNEGSTSLPYEPYQTVHDITRIPMRSKQLWDGVSHNGYITGTGIQFRTNGGTSAFITCKPNTTYSVNRASVVSTNRFYISTCDSSPVDYSEVTSIVTASNRTYYTFTTNSTAAYIIVYLNSATNSNINGLMVNEGDTVLPYVPYGMVEGWEVRDQQGRIIWGADKTITGTDSITYKGYGLDIKEYSIDGNMVQAAEKAYSITGTSPLDFQSNGSNATISISGNETQASNQAYTTSGTSPLSFNADGTNLTALSMDGNMNQASSQPYTISGTSPISFMNNGTAIDYTVSGNMNQSGTPTPTNPVIPSEVGEKTANLAPPLDGWDEGFITADGTVVKDSNYSVRLERTSGFIKVPDSEYVTFSYPDGFPVGTSGAWRCIAFYKSDNTYIQRYSGIGATAMTESIPQDAAYMRVSYRTYGETQNPMLNSGSTALDYEPYGYKIPVTNGSTTYNIYLSEPLRKIGDYSDIVNSDGSVTRVIKKIVFTGTETIGFYENRIFIKITDGMQSTIPAFCNVYQSTSAAVSEMPSHSIRQVQTGYWSSAKDCALQINDPNHNSSGLMQNFLETQYSAGTPVEVWYVLETPQTYTATVPTVTPTSGNNTLSVDTTLAPSNITITSNSSVFPGNPITPIECGVKTENLFDKTTVQNGYMISDETGNFQNGQPNDNASDYIPVSGDYVSIYAATTGSWRWGAFYDSSKTYISGIAGYNKSIAIPSNAVYMRLTVINDLLDTLMVNLGSEPLSYEPYGKYKIPITVGSTTKNIFINQPIRKIGNYSDSIGSDGVVTRNICKLVLTGEESTDFYRKNTDSSDNSLYYIRFAMLQSVPLNGSPLYCTHLQNIDYTPSEVTGINVGTAYNVIYFNFSLDVMNSQPSGNTVAGLREYLSDQYSAGTPVEVWYVLSTPDTTETTTIPTISTANGSNTLTTQTAITPSNITISTSSSVYPKNPIYPEECGDKTENLFDAAIEQGSFRIIDGTTQDSATRVRSQYMDHAIPAGTYTISAIGSHYVVVYAYTTNNASGYDTNESTTAWKALPYTFTTTKPLYLRFGFRKYGDSDTIVPSDVSNIMLNSGQTAATYEPYGYKIPITIGSNTNYIYTKEPIRKIGNYADVVNSDGSITRYIKKIELNGTENIILGSPQTGGNVFSITDQNTITENGSYSISNYYRNVYGNSGEYTYIYNGRIIILDKAHSTVSSFKQWLSDEYTSGNPVCVWYVMQTPTTEQTTIPTLTTADGKNTATIGTTLVPSSITINATSKVYPNNPIIPEECGDLTENLFDINGTWIKQANTDTISVSGDTVTITSKYYARMDFTLKPNTDYTYQFNTTKSSGIATAIYHDSTASGNAITVPQGRLCKFNTGEYTNILFLLYASNGTEATESYSDIMLVEGDYTQQTMPPYEPYGKYKVPIINNGVTQNIYLNQPIRKIGDYSDVINSDGTVTRNINKLVLNGSETWYLWNLQSETLQRFFTNVETSDASKYADTGCCSHLPVAIYNNSECIRFSTSGGMYIQPIIVIERSRLTTVDTAGLKTYLASEYAAGHPVEFWYVLATPQIESITAPTLSTIEGTNTIEVDTTLPPSKVDITGHIKPVQ